ncbi:MAG: hypothetical protein D3926_17705 [Desulfobacteraceae bacterium]|nr:MAG: hypothetical protein D3926_17705 [Desulfobacteraceae bacterium]
MEIETNIQRVQKYLTQYGFAQILEDEMIQQMKLYVFNPGEHIVRSHEKPEMFYFYVKGKSKVYQLLDNGKSLLCRFYNPPEIVGDVEIFSDMPNICNLQALTRVTCVGISVEKIRKAAESNNRLLMLLCRSLGLKLASFNMISAVNQKFPLENRLASYLAAVSEPGKKGEVIVSEIHTNNLTELADLLGSSYRHLTRTIKSFKDKGIVTKNNREIAIIDKKQLQGLAKDIYI